MQIPSPAAMRNAAAMLERVIAARIAAGEDEAVVRREVAADVARWSIEVEADLTPDDASAHRHGLASARREARREARGGARRIGRIGAWGAILAGAVALLWLVA